MTRFHFVPLAFTALLTLTGCSPSTPSTPAQPKITASPTSQLTPSVSDAAKEEDERFRRGVEVRRRKSNAADIDKTNAYRNYVP